MRFVTRGVGPAVLAAQDAAGLTEFDRAHAHFGDSANETGFTFEVYKRAAVRITLRDLFHGKCAYCEFAYDVGFTEDIEHFRPKGRIDIETEAGTQSIHPGYWWLGSSWDNLLPSCKRCNVVKRLDLYDGRKVKAGKGNRFPIADEATRAKAVGGESGETALLIDPCAEDPSLYLTFEIDDGRCLVVPKSADENSIEHKKARASIDIYGLNRKPLVKQRTEFFILLRAAIENLEIIIELMDTAPLEKMELLEARLSSEKRRIMAALIGDQAHTAMAVWVAAPILERLSGILR